MTVLQLSLDRLTHVKMFSEFCSCTSQFVYTFMNAARASLASLTPPGFFFQK
jgi:hypothetical protein